MKKFFAFFSVICFSFLFLTCGVPNYFYLSSSYLSWIPVKIQQDDSEYSKIECQLEIKDSFQLSKCKNCPSIFLFYTLDSNGFFSSEKNNIIYKFRDKYATVDRRGSLINTRNKTFTTIIDTYTPTNFANIKVSVFNLAFEGGIAPSRPLYHVPISCSDDDTPRVGYIKFLLQFNKQSRQLVLFYDYDEDSGDYLSSKELFRADGSSFSIIPSSASNEFESYAQEHIDYKSVDSSDLSNIRVHILGAMCASNGSFDNIYWSNLEYLTSFSLTGAI